MTSPDLAMSRFEAEFEGMERQLDYTQAGRGREVGVPTLGDLKTDEGQDEIGDLIAKEKASEALFVLQMGFTQAVGALEISEHSLNPETLLLPGHCLFGIATGSAKIPHTVPQAADDDVDSDRILVSILDVGEDDGCSLDGAELAQRADPATMVHKGVEAKTHSKGKALCLEPTEEFRASESSISQEQGSSRFGQQACYQGTHATLQRVWAMS